MRRALPAVAALALGVASIVPPARAAAVTSSSCPTREAVARAAHELLIGSPDGWESLAARLTLKDLDDHYLVSINGQSREYLDAAHDCAARAHAAAVFVALTLSPTTPMPATPPAPIDEPPLAARDDALAARTRGALVPVASSPGSTASAPGFFPRWRPEIELGATGAMAPRSDGTQKVGGVDLHVIAMTGRWGLVLGGSFTTSSTIRPMATPVTERRTPFDLGVRRDWTLGWLRASADLGALVALAQIKQDLAPAAPTVTRIEVGARAAAALATDGGSPIGAFLRLSAQLAPATREIAVEPRGIIGRTSPFWAAAAVGLVARFH